MELKTIRQVSQYYGISRQMLCYYEEIGLIKSSRKDDYAYRVYDEDAIKRLQQIVILRKLQIPMKHIKNILGNQDAVAVIEIFKQNIGELDEKITALSTLKSILKRFVDELQEKADVRLKLDLLNDKTMINLVDSLSFAKHKIKEKISMDELNQASETLSKYVDSKVRIVHLPPMTLAYAGQNLAFGNPESLIPYLNYLNIDTELVTDPLTLYNNNSVNMRTVLKKFIDDTELFKIKPDTRIFGSSQGGEQQLKGHGHWVGAEEMYASIPDDLDVPAPLKKVAFPGALYVSCPDRLDLEQWLEYNDDYEWEPRGVRMILEEFINPYNRYGLKNTCSEETGFVTDTLYPIREIMKIPDEQIEKMNTALAELEKSYSGEKTVEVDLTTMVKKVEDDSNPEMRFENNMMVLYKGEGWDGNKYMSTRETFDCPVKIELRAKTDKGSVCLSCAGYTIIIKWINKNILLVASDYGEWKQHRKVGAMPTNEFADIEWFIGKNVMAVKINGELRHIDTGYWYINEFTTNPEYRLSGAVSVGTEGGSTVTVESLRVTEF